MVTHEYTTNGFHTALVVYPHNIATALYIQVWCLGLTTGPGTRSSQLS